MNFSETLQHHLAAIQQRDLSTFLATLTTKPDFSLILPTGRLFRQRDDFVEFTRQWFADPDWRIHFELLRMVESTEMALALLSVTYDDLDASGQPYQLRYYLSLLFALEAGEWRLVHDQNTLLESA